MEAATVEAPHVPLEGEGEEPADLHEEVVLDTGDGQLSLQIGGKKPTVSKIVIRGGAIPLTGQKHKGEHVALRVECVVSAIHVIDKIDTKTREVVETVRKHVLKIEGVELAGESD